jgi:hypothetical protein
MNSIVLSFPNDYAGMDEFLEVVLLYRIRDVIVHPFCHYGLCVLLGPLLALGRVFSPTLLVLL